MNKEEASEKLERYLECQSNDCKSVILVKNASKEKTEDIDLENPQHFTKEQAL